MQEIAQGIPDVLISDIGMAGENGIELIRKVRSLEPERGGRVPAVALTAYAAAADRRQALLAGFQTHLPKPVEPDELLAVIASLSSQQETSGESQ
jgi:CheY-like chemotaxis protein